MTRETVISLMSSVFPLDRVSNIPENIGYSTFTSQIIIYIKICTEFESCEIRIVNLYNMCTTLGYDGNKLKCAFRKLF